MKSKTGTIALIWLSLRRNLNLAHAFLALFLLALTGCSTFRRDWRRAATEPTPADAISGRWEGGWQSDATGHSGRLLCLVTKKDDSKYLARFHANYFKIFSFGYAVNLETQKSGGAGRFKGEADLGKLAGGKYTYEGQATSTHFFSTYQAQRDRGTFRMTRP